MCLLVVHRVGHICMCMQTAQLHHSNTWKHAHFQPKDCCRLVNFHKAKQHIFPSNFEFARCLFSTFSWFKKRTLRGGNFSKFSWGMLFIPSSQNLARQVLFLAYCDAKVLKWWTIVSVRSHDSCWRFLLNTYEERHNASYRGTVELRLHTYHESSETILTAVKGKAITQNKRQAGRQALCEYICFTNTYVGTN